MGLIIFEGLFIIVLLIMTTFLFARKDEYGKHLAAVSLFAAITTILLNLVYIMLYLGISSIYTKIASKLMFSGIVVLTSFMLDLVVRAPYFDKKTWFTVLNGILTVGGVVFVAFLIDELSWNSLVGFEIISKTLTDGGLKSFGLFSVFYFLLLPLLSGLILFIRSFGIRSSIYRQNMVLTSVGCWFVGIALFSVYIFSQMIFSWMFAFFPIPYIVGILWVTYAFSLTIVFDRKEVLLLILRFLAFTLLFGVIAGLISGYVLSNIRNFQMQLVVIVGAVSVVFFVRQITQNKLFWIFGETKDYEKPFERALQEIDFTKGREDVMHDITEALRVYMGCSGIDILVTDDNFVMQTVFSSIDNTNRFDTTVSAFDYLINKNIQVLFQTELVTKYEYEEIRPDLNVIFSKTGADVMVFVRDNQRIIGAFALGKKSNKSEYGTYDLNVIKSFYSYFFLVIYYLRNIAKQNIVMTVDREVEMSDQIISSIQGAVEKIESKQIEIDSLNYSAYKLGGDFIDFLRLSENRYFFLIGDVAGKGLSASMSMVILKSVLHTFLEESQDFKELVVKMNLFVKQNLPKGTFFAGLFGIVDFSTGSVYYLNCGIPLMSMYISTYKNAIEIQGEGRVLGFVKNIKPFLKVRKIVMNPGDVIVFTTDGLLESENLRGDRFGKDRVSSILTESNAQPAKEITKAIYDRLNDFVSSELQDDVTILVFKHTGQ